MNPSVAAIVPHWNRRDLLEELFPSLRAQSRAFDEILVVDNGSSDDSVELAAGWGARVLRLERNVGFAAAVNRGLQACRTDWVAILNNDVTLAPNWLAALLEAAEREQAWFATGKLLRARNPLIVDGTFDEISRGACAWHCGSGKPDSALWNQAKRIRFAPMTAALFRRGLYDEIGGLDETFGSYLEDCDFGLRCALAGRDGVYVPAAVAYHRGSSTLGKWNSDTVHNISRNQVLLAAKYFRGQPRWPLLAGQLLWGLVALRHAQGWSYFRGKIAGLRMARSAGSTGKPDLTNPETLRGIIESSERTILELQRQTGFERYWRAYFWLSRP
jgi:N-acetylglucosaminyl-diphospho-decaprenol L-rhamnosyltransferase